MKKLVLIILLATGLGKTIHAQDSIVAVKPVLKTYKVAIFAPLYLDSIFKGNTYRYGKTLPRFVMPGLEFVQGATMALDSMPVVNGNINATVFDTKSYVPTLPGLLATKLLDSFNLIIGSVKDAEYIQLSDFAREKKIPFISATYPNDGGITDNPYLAIANPTLRSHCEAIFSYVLQTNSASNIILVRKKGAQEDKVESYFRNSNSPDGSKLLNIKTVVLSDDFTQINYHLDSTKPNIIIGGSLSEDFATKLATQVSGLTKIYNISLIGMPNWDGFRVVYSSKGLKDFPIYFTTPYYNTKWDATSRRIQSTYKRKYGANPSDVVFKAYELAFVYTRLLTRYPDTYMQHLNDYAYKVYSDYNFKPVSASSGSSTTDYYENKRLYLMKALNGAFSKAW